MAERAIVRFEDRKKKASAAAGSGRVDNRYTDHKCLLFSLLPERGDATATCRHAPKRLSALLPEDVSQDTLDRALRC